MDIIRNAFTLSGRHHVYPHEIPPNSDGSDTPPHRYPGVKRPLLYHALGYNNADPVLKYPVYSRDGFSIPHSPPTHPRITNHETNLPCHLQHLSNMVQQPSATAYAQLDPFCRECFWDGVW